MLSELIFYFFLFGIRVDLAVKKDLKVFFEKLADVDQAVIESAYQNLEYHKLVDRLLINLYTEQAVKKGLAELEKLEENNRKKNLNQSGPMQAT